MNTRNATFGSKAAKDSTMLTLTRQFDGSEFLRAAEHAFQQDEAANNLIYGLALRLAADPGRYQRQPFVQKPYLATVHDTVHDARLVCAALMTPPFRLVVYARQPVPPAAFDLLAGDLQAGSWPVPGVTAESSVGQLFAERWHAVTGQKYGVERQMRIFRLVAVDWPPLPPGRLRPAAVEDTALMWQWHCDFVNEAIPGDPQPMRENVQRSIEEGNIYLWDDQGPVSLAARGRRLPHGYSVGPVYTPPHLRGRGYASACVAALSQAILDGGSHFCTLFTDLANPTSNRIYQRLGYQPVCDYTEYLFEAPSA
jgi:RimJ/RimL family protein N-acetyltransferase